MSVAVAHDDLCKLFFLCLKLLMEADTSKRQIRKTRYCLTFENQYFEIDIYPNWKHTCVMEIELPSRETEVAMPDFIEIISDVTADRQYKNFAMSIKFPKELI